MSKKILLLGNQNSGKTTLFNRLTGLNQYVGNWPGVTVDKVSGYINSKDLELIDLPGLYSLSPYSVEEKVTRDALLYSDYDVILNVVDVTHLERSIYLTLEAMSFNKPMVIALNMADKIEDFGLNINISKLEEILGCKVVLISASNGTNIEALLNTLKDASSPNFNGYLDQKINDYVIKIKTQLLKEDQKDFVALSLIKQDEQYFTKYKDNPLIQEITKEANDYILKEFNKDSIEHFATCSYNFIDNLVERCVNKNKATSIHFTDSVDRIVTNKYLAFPIFFAIVWFVYYLSVSTVGTMATDYANDVIFGEYATNIANDLLISIDAPSWLSGLIIDGVIGGVGAVLGFVPQMIVLFFLLALLEQCGYMTRVAFILDRVFRYFGLSGKSFIPMIVASGCAVPALMSAKGIDNINERRLALITTSLIPCSAKLPILTMISVSFFPEKTWLAPAIYMLAIVSILITALILKKQQAFKEEVSPFVLELPDYNLPTIKNVVKSVYERCKAFVLKAGTLIFSTVVIVWFLSSFNFTQFGFSMVEVQESILATLGSAISFIFIPLGFGSYEATVAIITGLLAKENVVGTLAVLTGVGEVGEDSVALSVALQSVFTTNAAALAFLAFNLFSTPCVAALSAMKRRLESRRLFYFAVVYLLSFAYGLSFVIYELYGLYLGERSFNIGTIIALGLIALIVLLVLKKDSVKPSLKIDAKIV